MNALRPMISRNMVRSQHLVRSKATMPALEIISKNNQFKKQWLSDPSTYPIMLIMCGGMSWMIGMGANALFTYKDVQVNPSNRSSVMKDWSRDHRVSVMERFALAKGGVNPEGLGVSHEQWTKQKAEYLKQ
ncbi:NADH-ubiquinone reductase complex 1 MLRQ subunit [Nitzschia inconspicua]|uniref:NADH-ubiquinone reductase complex 1 MLRQ subunit n=1 Tax=Nitzschia inconspicua TaxID=303405 RepID=A0A9K3PFW4_9STRA|nr:NADH-ubiquinone reductase complex 1 MLRQ subunit [Nitzschia inconspicua]